MSAVLYHTSYGDDRGPRTQVGDPGGEKDTGFFAFLFGCDELGKGTAQDGDTRAGGTPPPKALRT